MSYCRDPKKDGDGLVSKRHPPSKQFSKGNRKKALESEDEEEFEDDCKDVDFQVSPLKKKASKNPKDKKVTGEKKTKPPPKPKKRKVVDQQEGDSTLAAVKPKKKKKNEVTADSVDGTPPKPRPKKPKAKVTAQKMVETSTSDALPTKMEMSVQTMESVPPDQPMTAPGAKLNFYYKDSNARRPTITQKKTTFEEEFLRKIAGLDSVGKPYSTNFCPGKTTNAKTEPPASENDSMLSEKSPPADESEPSMISTLASKVPKGVGIFKLATMMGNGTPFRFPQTQGSDIRPKKGKKKAAQPTAVSTPNDTNTNQEVQASTLDTQNSAGSTQNTAQHSQFQNLHFFNPLKSTVNTMGSLGVQGTSDCSQGQLSVSSGTNKPISAILQASRDRRALLNLTAANPHQQAMRTTASSVQQGMIPLSSICGQAKNAQVPQAVMQTNGGQTMLQQAVVPRTLPADLPYLQSMQNVQNPIHKAEHDYVSSPCALSEQQSPPPPILSPIPSPLRKIDQFPPHLTLSVAPTPTSPQDLQVLQQAAMSAAGKPEQQLQSLNTVILPNSERFQSVTVQPMLRSESSESDSSRSSDVSRTPSYSGVRGAIAEQLDISDLTPPASIKSTDLRIMEILAQAQRLKEAQEQQNKHQKQLEAQVHIL